VLTKSHLNRGTKSPQYIEGTTDAQSNINIRLVNPAMVKRERICAQCNDGGVRCDCFVEGCIEGLDRAHKEGLQSAVNKAMATALDLPTDSPQRSVAFMFAVETIIDDGFADNAVRREFLQKLQRMIDSRGMRNHLHKQGMKKGGEK